MKSIQGEETKISKGKFAFLQQDQNGFAADLTSSLQIQDGCVVLPANLSPGRYVLLLKVMLGDIGLKKK